jgi:hypothetical protein
MAGEMSYLTTHDTENELILIKVGGTLDLEKSKSVINDSDRLEKEMPGINILVDCTRVDTVDISQNDIGELAEHFWRNHERSGKTALVTGPQDDRHIMGMMYEFLVKDFEGRMVKVFRSVAEAHIWLAEDK